jgi:hypothetical protein
MTESIRLQGTNLADASMLELACLNHPLIRKKFKKKKDSYIVGGRLVN